MRIVGFQILTAACLSFTLTGCSGDLPFTKKGDYRIEGVHGDLEKYLNAVLDDRLSQEQSAPDDKDELARRETYQEQTIRADLVKAMESRGYYSSQAVYADDPAKSMTGVYTVDPGPLYKLSSVSIDPPAFVEFSGKIDAHAGDALAAESVLTDQKTLLTETQKDRCYFSMEITHSVLLNKNTRTGALTYHIKAGPEATFGPVTFKGQTGIKTSYLNKLVPWKQGSCYRQDKIEKLRAILLESGLFARAEAVLPSAPESDGSVPIVIDVTERAHRTVSAGLSYYTDEGPGVTLGWEHRNLFGAAEKFNAELGLSSLKQSLDLGLLKPFFLRQDQSLALNGSLRRQDTDAFEELGLDLGASINRTFHKRLTGSTGINFTLSQVDEDDEDTKTFGLISFPSTAIFDNRDDKLNPHKGWLLTGSITPFFDAFGESDPFLKTQGGASTYIDFGTEADLVLAMRAGLGSIWGSGTFEIPATERFYAGGGGTVRGFGYQEVGPFEDGDPTGGRSIATGSTELRFKVTDTIGGVVFVDAGSVSTSTTPDFDNLAVGAGVGARYYTSFGPLRFDVALPLTQKENLEQNYQIYISIGQAF